MYQQLIRRKEFVYLRAYPEVEIVSRDRPGLYVKGVRRLAMRFRGILLSPNVDNLKKWLEDAYECGVHARQRFARMLQSDLDAVTCGLTFPWRNGQTEGQIARLKMLTRSMYGRAEVVVLRARVLPL